MAHLIHHWTTLAPLAAAALLVLTTAIGEQPWLLVGCVAAIIAAVLAAVHHAEVIAHRVGEPLGTLVLPDFTITTGVGTYSRGQSLFVAVVSAALWGIFVFVQTVRHRDYFLPHDNHARPEEHALLVSVVTLGTGRTSMMQGAVHLVLFATYLFLACVP